ncbi:hypothetical protein G7054_g9128 [Neopestalotiopsis clavispora]|nr:hypothetical protein G7054_g9128 [Neopestalotiopsis clavispora]
MARCLNNIIHRLTSGQRALATSDWRELAKREPGTTAVILGRQDELIQKGDYKEDALPLMGGEGNVFWRVVSGGHNMPFTNSREVIEAIHEFWGIKE